MEVEGRPCRSVHEKRPNLDLVLPMSRTIAPLRATISAKEGPLIIPGAEFRPLPLLRNRHVQTLLGHFLRGPAFKHRSRPRVMHLPDGDALVLHDSVPRGWVEGEPIAILVHGLTGSHASAQVQRLAIALLHHSYRVVRLDLRGCG